MGWKNVLDMGRKPKKRRGSKSEAKAQPEPLNAVLSAICDETKGKCECTKHSNGDIDYLCKRCHAEALFDEADSFIRELHEEISSR